MYILFWIFLLTILYAYLGYPLILFILNIFFKIIQKRREHNTETTYEPEVTIFIAAYNEVSFIEKKIKNSFSLDYPKEKIQHVWVTDGSNDGTPEFLQQINGLKVYHNSVRKGKTGAINRGMEFINTPIVIFTDANSMINKDAIRHIVVEFKNSGIGCVAGEKRIEIKEKDNAVNIGEGIYWKYESLIKKFESNINTALGAAGELFAIRTELFEKIEDDIILDDFIISMRIIQKGYKIKYTPKAYATERASININEELKRKTRIAYGGFQAISRLRGLLNPFNKPFLTFQYWTHKVLRWTVVPLSFLLLFVVNFYLAFQARWSGFYSIVFMLQGIFYILAFIGYIFQSIKTNLKLLFVPYYLFVMNLSEIMGFIKFIQKKQSVNWERSKRE